MLEDTLLDLSNRSDIVVIHSSARAQLSSPPMRPAASVELDPLYIDVIIRRYETATGNPAVLIGTGEAFELLAARRSSQTAPV